MSRSSAEPLPKRKTKFAHKRIKLRTQRPEVAASIESELSLNPATSRVLASRGYQPDKVLKSFINPTLKEGLPPPQELKNIDAACELIGEVLKGGGKIGVCCDFDVDGLSGGAQVCHFFQAIGAHCEVHVPDRFEDGYGLNKKMIQQIADNGCQLMIAIDYGTTNLKELDFARELGIKTIVIDHHHVGDHKPSADVFVNPQQAGCGFAGGILSASALAWYLIVALRTHLKSAAKVDPKSYLDLTCLGTICDMVPLVGANRVIAKKGLEVLDKTQRAGLIALKNVIGIKKQVGCSDVSFGIGPRLNAAGRLVHGSMVIDLLTTSDTEKAQKLAQQLNDLNIERQDTEVLVKEKAVAQILKYSELPAGLVAWDPSFHTGVIGIVAQRLVESFYRPAAVLGADSNGVYKGSVRGIKGFNVVEALGSVSKHLVKFGGHEGAGGFSVEEKNLHKFIDAFVKECERRLSNIETEPVAEADTEVLLEELSLALVDELKMLAPFGMGNPQPLLLMRGLKVVEVREIKSAHLRATLSSGKKFITGLMWRQTDHPALKVGKKVDIVFKADYSTYQGLTELQATLQAVEAVTN